MENVNEILKRQLLLMKFDSGVTLKENYEKVSGKRILSEGKSDVVKGILDGCNSRNNNYGRMVDDNAIEEVIRNYNKAFQGVGTSLDHFDSANSTVTEKFSYSDLCRLRDAYPYVAGEDTGFYEAIDSDIDYDSEWQKVLDAFNAAKRRDYQEPAQQQGQQPAPAPAPAPIANPESGDMYMKPGGLAHTFDFFKRTFPCVFAQNRVDTQEVYNNGSYDYILIVAPGGQVIQMYFDGFLREQRTLADVTYNGVPAKISCDGNKIKIVGR